MRKLLLGTTALVAAGAISANAALADVVFLVTTSGSLQSKETQVYCS